MDVGAINNVRINDVQPTTASSCKGKVHDEQPKVTTKPDMPDKEEMVKHLEQILQDFHMNNVMKISYDKEVNRIVVQVLDGDTSIVVKQIPSEDSIAFARRFKQAVGAIVERSA